MSEVTTVHGSCLCGTVAYEASGPFHVMVHCHCSRCRKATGAGHATNLTVAPAQFRLLKGEEAITRFDLPQARSFGKWFCHTCGCSVPRKTRDGKLIVIPAGSLDSDPLLFPTDHIFWNSRAPWGCSNGALPVHAEYPESW